MTFSPLIKPKRQDQNCQNDPLHGWTAPKNPIKASDFPQFMSGPASRFIVGLRLHAP